MTKQIVIIYCLLFNFFSYAQITWSGEAAEVIYNNCTSCHNPNGIAPNSFMTYQESSNYSPLINSFLYNK